MWIRDEIIGVADARSQELGADMARSLFDKLEARFARPGHRPLWERLTDFGSVQDSAGWHRIREFIRAPVVLLVQDAQGQCGFLFSSVVELDRVLQETSGFEFYVTDADASYLLAFNHHDFLIGAGAAEAWVRSLAP